MGITAELVSFNSIVRRSDNIISQDLDDDIVMANIDSGHYFGIDRTSKRIWELLATPVTVKELCIRLCQEYDVDADSCEKDVKMFIADLAHEGLIQIV